MITQTDIDPFEHAPSEIGLLIVDDDEDVRLMLGMGLRREGFPVWLAGCGHEALAIYRRQRESIQVVLMDVRMPDLDGPQTFVALREVDPEVRCCFMTGNLGSYTTSGLITMGAARVIRKPFRIPDVATVLRSIARARPGQTATT